MKNNKKIFVYDTTLRDGAQGAGVSFSLKGKLDLARKMDEFGFDYIEGGYAGANQKEMEFFSKMKSVRLKHAKLAAFGSTRRVKTNVKKDSQVDYLIKAGTPVVTIYGKSWRLHVKDVLRTTDAENMAMIHDTVAYLKDKKKEVIFDAEHYFDGFKDDPDFALMAVQSAVDAGADVIVLCDTNGGCLPHEVFDIVSKTKSSILVPLGIHVHNDSGMAAANTIEAVRAGVIQIQGTLNGLGERCGNANLCTVIPNLELKMGRICVGPKSLKRIMDLSEVANDYANLRDDDKAPYVGQNAFTHKAGTHIDAVNKNSKSFEHVDPTKVGNDRKLLVSEHSGGSSILLKAIELGVGRDKSPDEIREVLKSLKELEHKGYSFESADASFRMLIQKVLKQHKAFFDLEGFRVIIEKRSKDAPCISEASIKVRVNNEIEQTVSEGDGPVNALDGALRKALVRFYPEIAKVFLTDYRVRILDPETATAAKTQVIIESSDGKNTWGTVGVSGNIIEASWEALVDSVEYKLFKDEESND